MGSGVSRSGAVDGLCGVLGIERLLVPIVVFDAVPLTDPATQGQPGSPVAAQQPTAVGALDLELGCDVSDRRVTGSGAKLLGSEVHAATLVSLGHGVKSARIRLISVPRKTGQLKAPELLALVGDRFRQERENKHLTLDELAKKVGMNRQGIGRFERGERGIEVAAFVALLLAASEYGVDVGFVLTGSRDPAAEAIRTALLDPAIRAGLREAGLQALAARTQASADKK
jgi:transcriptional regulator with XRE-family HTH domain